MVSAFAFLVSGWKSQILTDGKVTWRMFSVSANFTEADAIKTKEVYEKRLIKIGIKKENFVVTLKDNRLLLK